MMDGVTNVIVGASLLAAAAFFVAWATRPVFRRQVEAPKYRFLDALERYDRRHAGEPDGSHERR
jgi:hypothetical protein